MNLPPWERMGEQGVLGWSLQHRPRQQQQERRPWRLGERGGLGS